MTNEEFNLAKSSDGKLLTLHNIQIWYITKARSRIWHFKWKK